MAQNNPTSSGGVPLNLPCAFRAVRGEVSAEGFLDLIYAILQDDEVSTTCLQIPVHLIMLQKPLCLRIIIHFMPFLQHGN